MKGNPRTLFGRHPILAAVTALAVTYLWFYLAGPHNRLAAVAAGASLIGFLIWDGIFSSVGKLLLRIGGRLGEGIPEVEPKQTSRVATPGETNDCKGDPGVDRDTGP